MSILLNNEKYLTFPYDLLFAIGKVFTYYKLLTNQCNQVINYNFNTELLYNYFYIL